jgi:hypothetical protein
MLNKNQRGRSLNEWDPPDTAESFIHSSINYCDEMDTHNQILDCCVTIDGTTGTTDHELSKILEHDFNTYWKSNAITPEDDQYFEITLSNIVIKCDSYIMNFHVPYSYSTAPYIPDMSCWKAWTLKGKVDSSDSWTTLETVTANSLKFYRGSFTSGDYKYFRVDGISVYDDQSQTNRIDAYLYTMGLYNSSLKYIDKFPDTSYGRNDYGNESESERFKDNIIYITKMIITEGSVYDLNGEISKVVKGETLRQYRHIGGFKMEFNDEEIEINRINSIKMTRLNSIDFVANTGICLYMFTPPNELWWFVGSGYAFDETIANINTPIILKVPDNAQKLSPSWTTTRNYSSYSVLGARYTNTQSGTFKFNKYFITFSDPTNMESQIRFDGQEGKGLICDMNGTALTGATNASSNVNVARLKIGDIWKGRDATVIFDPPIKLDGDNLTETFEMQKTDKVKGSVFRYTLEGFKVPK